MKAVSAKVGAGAVIAVLLLGACGGGSKSTAAAGGGPENTSSADKCASVDLSKPPAKPVDIKLGVGLSTEEQVWLQSADKSVDKYNGTFYNLSIQQFRASEDRLTAFQAGQLQGGTISSPALIRAVSKKLDLAAVASIAIEASGYFNTQFVSLPDSGIKSPADLKGKRIGIADPSTATEYWAKTAVKKAGLDPDRDVKYVVLPFPAQADALRNKQIDVAVLVEPFYTAAIAKGPLTTVFTSLTGPGFDHELLDVFFGRSFLKDHLDAYCAWRADYVSSTKSYLADRAKAAHVLIDAKILPGTVDSYMKTKDWKRPEDGRIDLANLDKVINQMVDLKILNTNQKVSASQLVSPGLSLTR